MVMILSAMLLFSLTGCGETETKTETKQEKASEQVIYEDKSIIANYEGFSDGMLKVKLENLTEDEITVLPMDSSVDGKTVQFTSGTLATMQGGKSFTQAWITGAEDPKEVELSLSICNADMDEITRTDILKIEIK